METEHAEKEHVLGGGVGHLGNIARVCRRTGENVTVGVADLNAVRGQEIADVMPPYYSDYPVRGRDEVDA